MNWKIHQKERPVLNNRDRCLELEVKYLRDVGVTMR